MSTLPALRPICRPMTRSIFDAGKKSAERIISDLFAQGQQGFWLPFTDFASLSQDSAGTLPYTALEQPVGLILDKSKGGGRGPELSPNGGTFDDAAGWTITHPTSSISGGVLNVGAGACNIFPPTASVVAGKSYEVTFTISNSTANYGIRILNKDIINTGDYFPAGGQYITANGSYRFVCVAISNGSIGVNRVIGHTGSLQIDNFSVKEIPGNHATQPTSTARGAVSARVNLLVSTENFTGSTGAPWSNNLYSNWSIAPTTADAALAPNGAMTADLVMFTSNIHNRMQRVTGLQPNATYRFSVFMKAASASNDYGLGLLLRAASGNSGALVSSSLANSNIAALINDLSYTRVTLDITIPPSGVNEISIGISGGGGGTINASVYVWGASLVRIDQSFLPYQRVNTPTDYDSVGFPKYARLDGVDDNYTCGGGGSTTGFYYSDVVRPTSSTFSALLDDSTGNGGYLVQRTNTGIHFSAQAGAATSSVSLPLAANAQAFVAAFDDGVNLVLQVAGGQASTARPAVTAGSSTMRLGRYSAIAQYFAGTMTEPIYRAGPPPSAYERSVIRAYQMQKAGL